MAKDPASDGWARRTWASVRLFWNALPKQPARWALVAFVLLMLAGCFQSESGGEGRSSSRSWWERLWSSDVSWPEAGSTVGGGWPESGSLEAGSVEAGSSIGEAGSVSRTHSDRFREGIVAPPIKDETGLRFRNVASAALVAVICLLGLSAAFLLFRLGIRPPYGKELWSRRMNLANEIAGNMDVFLAAAYREEWDVCRRALAAMNDLNGQRVILLGDAANRRVLEFMTAAVDCRANRDNTAGLPNLRIKQVHALASLRREVGRQDELSETLLRSLRDTRHLYQSLRAETRR